MLYAASWEGFVCPCQQNGGVKGGGGEGVEVQRVQVHKLK